MNCKNIREQLHQSLDGAPADSALREHLAVCVDCRADMTAMRQAVTALGVLSRVTAPAFVMANVMAAVRQRPLGDVRVERQRHTLSLLAATLALLGSLLLAVAEGDVWVTLTTASLDDTATVAEQLDARASLVDPVMMAEQLPAAAESGGVPFVAGLCLLFVAGTTELISLLVPATRPAANADTIAGASSFQRSR